MVISQEAIIDKICKVFARINVINNKLKVPSRLNKTESVSDLRRELESKKTLLNFLIYNLGDLSLSLNNVLTTILPNFNSDQYTITCTLNHISRGNGNSKTKKFTRESVIDHLKTFEKHTHFFKIEITHNISKETKILYKFADWSEYLLDGSLITDHVVVEYRTNGDATVDHLVHLDEKALPFLTFKSKDLEYNNLIKNNLKVIYELESAQTKNV